MRYFAVIDTETNWHDAVMSVGTVIADRKTFCAVDAKYHVLTPEYRLGGMYSDVLFPDARLKPVICSREAAMRELLAWLKEYDVEAIFAYNAVFDRTHLPELGEFRWYDIMKRAAYRQYNPKIPHTAECCSTGRLKRGYGVEAIMRMLSGDCSYCETHNAICDALDELEIMRFLAHDPQAYAAL